MTLIKCPVANSWHVYRVQTLLLIIDKMKFQLLFNSIFELVSNVIGSNQTVVCTLFRYRIAPPLLVFHWSLPNSMCGNFWSYIFGILFTKLPVSWYDIVLFAYSTRMVFRYIAKEFVGKFRSVRERVLKWWARHCSYLLRVSPSLSWLLIQLFMSFLFDIYCSFPVSFF